MRLFGLLASLYCGLLLSLGLAAVAGEGGLLHLSRVRGQHSRLEENIESLEHIHRELVAEMETLAGDPEAVRLLARDLGYYRPEERVIKVVGLPSPTRGRTVGRLVRGKLASAPVSPPGWVRYVLFLAPAAVYLLLRPRRPQEPGVSPTDR